jgi:hypothetical protein
MSYGNGDTSVAVTTDMKIIYSYTVSQTSITAKPVVFATVAGGVITFTVTDPLAGCYLFVTAWGLPK